MMALKLPQLKFLVAGALLLCASLLAGYRGWWQAEAHAAAGLQTMADMVRIEAGAGTATKPAAGGMGGATLPDLLAQTQRIATDYNVAILSVLTTPADAKKITLGVHGDFRDVMQFLGRLETFQVALNSFDFAPDESGVSGTIEIAHVGKPGAPDAFADYLDAVVKYSAVRNPFEIGDPIPLPNTVAALGDLTWTYHLTSISQVGAERVATIDGRDYRPGERLNDLEVVAIGPSSVSLSAPHQAVIQKLHFRHNPAQAQL